MYELLIKLYNELDYKKYTIKELKEMRDILSQFAGKTLEVRLKKTSDGTASAENTHPRRSK